MTELQGLKRDLWRSPSSYASSQVFTSWYCCLDVRYCSIGNPQVSLQDINLIFATKFCSHIFHTHKSFLHREEKKQLSKSTIITMASTCRSSLVLLKNAGHNMSCLFHLRVTLLEFSQLIFQFANIHIVKCLVNRVHDISPNSILSSSQRKSTSCDQEDIL